MGILHRAPRAPRARRRVAAAVVVLVTATLLTTPARSTAAPAPAPAPGTPPAASPRPTDLQDFAGFPDACDDDLTSVICRVVRAPGRPWVVLWGDSHALQYQRPLRGLARQLDVNLVLVFSGGCPLSLPFGAASSEPRLTCDEHNARALDYVLDLASRHRVRVVLGSWWAYYRAQHAKLVRERRTGVDSGLSTYQRHVARLAVERSRPLFRVLGRAGIAADVLAQAGTVPLDAPACPAGDDPYVCDLPRARVLPLNQDNRAWLRRLSTALAGTPRVIDPSPTYCGDSLCFGRIDGIDTFYNAFHLGSLRTSTMRTYFRPTFRAVLRGR